MSNSWAVLLSPRTVAEAAGGVKNSDGPQPRGAASASSVWRASIFSNAWAFPGRHLSLNTENDLDTNVVRTLMQSRKAGLRSV
jgi:hypothetical protein